MKICVTAQGKDLDSQVDPRFGRCQYFLMIDPEALTCESMENPNRETGGGAGIRSGQMMSSHGVQAVLTGHMGPNAFRTIASEGVQVYLGVSGPVREAVEKFKQGQYRASGQPDTGSHQTPLS